MVGGKDSTLSGCQSRCKLRLTFQIQNIYEFCAAGPRFPEPGQLFCGNSHENPEPFSVFSVSEYCAVRGAAPEIFGRNSIQGLNAADHLGAHVSVHSRFPLSLKLQPKLQPGKMMFAYACSSAAKACFSPGIFQPL
mgnify:FL=1